MAFGYYGTYFFRLQSDRNVVLYNGTFFTTGTSSSERRLKKNIKQLTGARDLVNRLQSVTFEYVDAVQDPGKKVGFIADDLINIVPECVQTIKHPESGEESKLVREEKIVPFLVQSIQEMSSQLNSLEAQVKSLSADIAELKKSVKNKP